MKPTRGSGQDKSFAGTWRLWPRKMLDSAPWLCPVPFPRDAQSIVQQIGFVCAHGAKTWLRAAWRVGLEPRRAWTACTRARSTWDKKVHCPFGGQVGEMIKGEKKASRGDGGGEGWFDWQKFLYTGGILKKGILTSNLVQPPPAQKGLYRPILCRAHLNRPKGKLESTKTHTHGSKGFSFNGEKQCVDTNWVWGSGTSWGSPAGALNTYAGKVHLP